jgi:tetratricopeptide (TPR) repeat protein
MRRLIYEIHRRSLWQVLGLYAAGSWVVLQVVDQLIESAGLPDWVGAFALVLLLIGFPIVLATAFVQEGTPAADDATDSIDAGGPVSEVGAEESAAAASGEPVPTAAPIPATDVGSHGRLFTWRNAIAGGVLAFALLVVVTAGFMFMRTRGIGPVGSLIASGLLDERSPVVLATFESGDPDLARAATEAFRVDLSQSPVVRLAEPSFLAAALDRMQRPADTRIDLAIGREIGQREGIPAVFGGEINVAGGAYVVSAELVRAEDGSVLASHRETAADSSEVVEAINRVSRELRERIGESYTSLRASPPLENVTTPSLEALRKYTEAIAEDERNMDSQRAIALIEEAVTVDPEFAMAWRKLGVFLANREEQRGRSLEAFTQAYEHRDRLTDRERYLAVAAYNDWALGRPDLTIQAYDNMLALDPSDHWALNNLSVKYWQLGQFRKAAELADRLVLADSSSRSYAVGAVAAYDAGQVDVAVDRMAIATGAFPPNPTSRTWAAFLALDETGDYEAYDRALEALAADMMGNLYEVAGAQQDMAKSDAARGRLHAALAHLESAEAAHRDRGRPPEALDNVILAAWFELDVGRDTAAAIERVASGLRRYPLAPMDALERPYLELAYFYATTGRVDDAHRLLDEMRTEVPEVLARGVPGNGPATRAGVARAEGRYADALREGREESSEGRRGTGQWECASICESMSLAMTFDMAGQADSATAYYGTYANARAFGRVVHDGGYLGRTLERLGQLYDDQGDLENAAVYYARFAELWADADPELQPRVQAARTRLEEIVRERG